MASRLTRTAMLALLGISAVLALVPASGSGASTPRCATSSLRLDFVSSDVALSHEFWNLALRNVGSATCHLKGFSRVGLLDVNAKPINDPAFRETGFKQRDVVLKPWQRAYFTFGYAVSGPCVPNSFDAYGLQVIPPDATRRLVYYRGRFDVCGQSLSHPTVYPVRPTLNHL